MDEPIFYIKPPEGYTFRECDICKSPYAFDGKYSNCLFCELTQEPDVNPIYPEHNEKYTSRDT